MVGFNNNLFGFLTFFFFETSLVKFMLEEVVGTEFIQI